mgnify:CR=1 FL=1
MLRVFTHIKMSRMIKKKDVQGLLKYLIVNIDRSPTVAGKAMIGLARIGKPASEAICKILPSIKHAFLKFALIRVLYTIGDLSCVNTLIDLVKEYGEKIFNRKDKSELNFKGETSVYFMALKTLKHMGTSPSEWGISSEPYYTQIREDYEKCENVVK